MNNQQNWVEALNISPESLSAWSAQAPSGTPLLVYCLEQGFIPLDEYLNWAQSHFEVPVLEARFFSEAFDPARVTVVRDQGDWHPWHFPVETWDGVTLVACVEVPAEEERGDFRYVLADPRAMREAWAAHGTAAPARDSAPPPLSSYEAPVGISANAPKPFTLNLDLSTALHAPDAPEAAQESQVSIQLETDLIPQPEVTQATGVTELKTAKRDLSDDEHGAIKELFANLATRFQTSLILKTTETSARVKIWDEQMKIDPNHPNMSVNLTYPTFLRIVAKTLMPYHGYLMDSAAHRDFFQALGYENLPACVTAIPIKTDGQLWGIVVAIGSDQNQKMDSLAFVQEQTDAFIAKLGVDWIKAS